MLPARVISSSEDSQTYRDSDRADVAFLKRLIESDRKES
jgi:hypothetical protein